jgi:hypothetical protein
VQFRRATQDFVIQTAHKVPEILRRCHEIDAPRANTPLHRQSHGCRKIEVSRVE